MKLPIWSALLLSLLGVIWGTYLVTSTSSELNSQQALEQHAQQIMGNIASYAMEQSQNYLGKAQRATELTKRLLNSQVLARESAETLESYFTEQLQTYPDIAGIYLGTPTGEFYYVSRNSSRSPNGFRTKIIRDNEGERQVELTWRNSNREFVGRKRDVEDTYDPRKRPWFKGALKTRDIFWSDPYVFYSSQKPGITISGPSYRNDGSLRGIVGVDIEIDQLSTFIADLRIGSNGRALLLNRNRDVVAFHDLEKIKLRSEDSNTAPRLVKIEEFQDKLCRGAFSAAGLLEPDPATRKVILTEPTYAKFTQEGINYLAMFTPFPDPQWPWIIGMYMPEDDYLGGLKRSRRESRLLTLGMSIFASFLALILARSLARPMAGLRHFAEAIEHQDFDQNLAGLVSNSRFKEVSSTAQRFEQMRKTLKQEQSERQTAEQNLDRSEKDYQSLVNHLPLGVYRTRLDGTILRSNPAHLRMSGIESVAELNNHKSSEFYCNSEDRPRLINLLKTDGRVHNFEARFQPKDRQEAFWGSLTAILKHDTETDESFIDGVIEDISERKQQEEQLVASERMAALGVLAGGVAHEFNNLHTGVLGYAELAHDDPDTPAGLKPYLDVIRTSALRAKDLTGNLLSFASQNRPHTSLACLNQTARETLTLVEREFASEGIIIETSFARLPRMRMDKAQIGQVILNFLINARHALLDRTQKHIKITTGVEAGKAWVEISDSGCGIPEEQVRQIFTPFFSTKGEHANSGSPQVRVRGTGLGLSVCHTIAKNHSGEILVESRVNEGTTITLRFPLVAVGKDLPDQVQAMTQGSSNGRRVLILDDEPVVQKLVSEVLHRRGLQTLSSDDGKEAMQILRESDIDLVLVDVQMPKMSGVDFVRQLDQLDAERRPAVILFTGRKDAESIAGYHSLGVAGVVFKPFRLAELTGSVERVLAERRSATA